MTLHILERLSTFAFMAFMSLVCGLLMLISAREGKSGWAWFWALVFVITSVLTDMHFWGGWVRVSKNNSIDAFHNTQRTKFRVLWKRPFGAGEGGGGRA